MNIFDMHRRVTGDYSTYVRSYLTIADEQVREFVAQYLINERTLWPDALLQLNPAYQKAATVAEVVQQGVLRSMCADIFRDKGSSIHLYRHQQEAIERASNVR
jgi:ATP-dependent helicase YprA (DUF1998 family)